MIFSASAWFILNWGKGFGFWFFLSHVLIPYLILRIFVLIETICDVIKERRLKAAQAQQGQVNQVIVVQGNYPMQNNMQQCYQQPVQNSGQQQQNYNRGYV